MAFWSVKTAAGVREGLTIYQLQQLVSSGQVGAADEVSQGGPWARVDATPALAKVLPAPEAAAGQAKYVDVAGFRLEVGPDGKPKPPPPEVLAKMLAGTSDAPKLEKSRQIGRIVIGITLAVFAVEAILLLRLLLFRPE